MGIALALLAAAISPIGYVPQHSKINYIQGHAAQNINDLISSPAICLLNNHRRIELASSLTSATDGVPATKGILRFNTTLVAMSLTYLLTGYAIRVIRLSQYTANAANNILRIAPIGAMCNLLRKAKSRRNREHILSRLWQVFLLVCIILSEALCEVGISMLWEIFWLATALLWGTFQIVQHRRYIPLDGENTWGFGQVLAILISALPLWSLVNIVYETIQAPSSMEPPSTTLREIEGLGRLNRYPWFHGLLGFLVGTAMTIVGATITAFGASTLFAPLDWMGTDSLYDWTGSIAVVYIIAMSWTAFMSAAFIAVALTFQFRVVGLPRLLTWSARHTASWTIRTQQRAHV